MANDTFTSGIPAAQPVNPSLVTYAHIIYALHAFGVTVGLITTATTVIGGLLFSLPSIIAVIMNYVKRAEVRGTYLESHFTWQIRTFWFALLWAVGIGAVSAVLLIVLIGFATWFIGLLALSVWIIYRVARGWLALRDRRAMYV